jgi:thiosulfate reductase cytochrome b subunit
MSNHKLYIYPFWLRVWHIFNAFACLILIVTGMSMQYSSQDAPLITFRVAVQWHNVAGIILAVNYFTFLIGNAFSTNGNHYRVIFKGVLKRLKIQMIFYSYGIFKGRPEPFPVTKQQKFNPLQQSTYILIMYVVCPLIIITGCLMFFPEFIKGNIFDFSSFLLVDIIHVFTGFFVSLFLVIHIYFSTISHDHNVSSRFKSILTGYHEE